MWNKTYRQFSANVSPWRNLVIYLCSFLWFDAKLSIENLFFIAGLILLLSLYVCVHVKPTHNTIAKAVYTPSLWYSATLYKELVPYSSH